MTGISADWVDRNSRDDTPEKRYVKMCKVASKYSIIQFGLCLYHEQTNGTYLASPYNFYLFPENSHADIVMSASSIDFLRKNHMDFGTWISKGRINAHLVPVALSTQH